MAVHPLRQLLRLCTLLDVTLDRPFKNFPNDHHHGKPLENRDRQTDSQLVYGHSNSDPQDPYMAIQDMADDGSTHTHQQ